MNVRFCVLSLSLLLTAADLSAQSNLTIVSSASGAGTVAPNSLVSAFGANLASQTAQADGLPLPTTLGGIGVQVSDSAGIAQVAGLVFVSAGQINFVMPMVAVGPVTVMVVSNSNLVARGTVQVQATAVGVFSADGNGTGVAAANALIAVDVVGPVSVSPVFQCSAPGICQPVVLNLGVDTPMYLELFGTGLRAGKSFSATIGSVTVNVLYAGPQPTYPGLDQVNLPVPLNLRGAGTVNVVLTVDGQMSNPVQIAIQ